MQEKQSFEYAVIRVVPMVEREEFLNVGVILYCPAPQFLQMIYTLDKERLRNFSPNVDITEIENHLLAFQQIALGLPEAGPIAKLDAASRFRWLTATRSTVVQASKVHPGLCTDPFTLLNRLHQQLVMQM